MIKNIFIYIFLAYAAFSMWACSDQLDALPSQKKVDGNLIVDATSAERAINGLYYTFANCGTDVYGTLSTNVASIFELYPGAFSGIVAYFQIPWDTFSTHSFTSSDPYALRIWSYYYKVLEAANSFIYQMENNAGGIVFENNRDKEMLGEAYAIRAYTHLLLLRDFGYHWDASSTYGVLLRTEPVVVGNISKARSTVKESYEAILSDLDYAIANCSAKKANASINKWVAMGLKARALMMRGQNNDYADAASIADAIINTSPYVLDSMYDIFQKKGVSSTEVMFASVAKASQRSKYMAYFYYFKSAGDVNYCVLPVYSDLFQDDPRKSWIMKDYGPGAYSASGGYESTGVGFTKYINTATLEATSMEETTYFMRLTELYLLRAEALVHVGGAANEATAKFLLKEVMGKAGISDYATVDAASGNDLLVQVFYEALKNLGGESGREQEMLFRVPESVAKTISKFISTKSKMVYPIPQTELDNNAKFGSKNPGY